MLLENYSINTVSKVQKSAKLRNESDFVSQTFAIVAPTFTNVAPRIACRNFQDTPSAASKQELSSAASTGAEGCGGKQHAMPAALAEGCEDDNLCISTCAQKSTWGCCGWKLTTSLGIILVVGWRLTMRLLGG